MYIYTEEADLNVHLTDLPVNHFIKSLSIDIVIAFMRCDTKANVTNDLQVETDFNWSFQICRSSC